MTSAASNYLRAAKATIEELQHELDEQRMTARGRFSVVLLICLNSLSMVVTSHSFPLFSFLSPPLLHFSL